MKPFLKGFSIAALAAILSFGASADSKAYADSYGGTNEVTKGIGTGYVQQFTNMTSSATWNYSYL